MIRVAAPLVAFALLLLLGALGWPGARLVPPPGELLGALAEGLTSASLWRDVGASLARLAVGGSLAVLVGGALGVALGASRTAWRAAEPLVEWARSVPPILVYPLLLLGLGYGEPARVATIALGGTLVVLLPVAEAVARAPSARAEVVRLAGLRGLDAALHLHLFEALPALVVAARLAIAAGLIVTVVTEMVGGAESGLGARALSALVAYRADRLWVVILVAGSLGQALSLGAAALGRRLVRWEV